MITHVGPLNVHTVYTCRHGWDKDHAAFEDEGLYMVTGYVDYQKVSYLFSAHHLRVSLFLTTLNAWWALREAGTLQLLADASKVVLQQHHMDIYAIQVNDRDVTSLIYAYIPFIALPRNVTARQLYLLVHFMEGKPLPEDPASYTIKITDYDLNIKTVTGDNYIVE